VQSRGEGGAASSDVAVVGAGPNGLAAAIALAHAGRSVIVLEAEASIGGGVRSAELTLPGFVHDVCSAVYPLGLASPFFRALPLGGHGLEWIHPPAPLAHPFDDGTAALLERSVAATGRTLGPDGGAWARLFEPLVGDWQAILDDVLAPPGLPRHPVATARFGLRGIRSVAGLARSVFRGPRARALLAGLAAHAPIPLDAPGSAAFGLVLGFTGHAVGWPIPRGGAGRLAGALASLLGTLGGTVRTGTRVESVDDLAAARTVLLDLTPRQVLRVAGHRLPAGYRAALGRYRYGAAAFKVDWALRGPIPWRATECGRAGTVHLGGTLEEIAASERAAATGEHAERPFVLLAQPTLFDAGRAPAGRYVAWAYCHVPNGSAVDVTERIEAQVERFAPGFRELVLARSVRPPAELERHNANLVGGDINGGALDLRQVLLRPMLRASPYRTPTRGLYLCSASTSPGPGVHGMCGYHAARAALSDG
jgi:phytoene dehydrogenase-like protein